MASFTGTKSEFHRFYGPYLRNLVQQVITAPARKLAKACQKCGAPKGAKGLDAVHVRGRSRIQIIDQILGQRLDPAQGVPPADGAVFTVDLTEFEKEFKAAHSPVEKAIQGFYCKLCHTEYDQE